MTLHLLGLPHSETTKEWESDAYTARTRVLGSMLSQYGNVILYAGEQNESRVTEHVPIVDRTWQARHFPVRAPVFTDYDADKPHWVEFNVRAAEAIRQRSHPGDLLGITMGTSHERVAALTRDLDLIPVEVGIGYLGVWAEFRVYESWAWRFYHSGLSVGRSGTDTDGDVRNFDEVIPRPYEVSDFPLGSGGDYFLFMGRLVARKGPHIAAEVCRRIGAKTIYAGQHVAKVEPGKITTEDGIVLEGDVEYAGIVSPEERAKLLGGAIATFCPTLYNEPFGGAHAESMLTGTPVLSADWGVFHENVIEGTGFRCRTLAEFVAGARNVGSLDRAAIRRYALGKFSTEAVGPQTTR